MSKKIKCLTSISRFLNQKGQDVVEFALLCAFCVGIGLAAREAGLGEALDKAFAGTSDTAAPSAIEAGKAEGTTSTNVSEVIGEGDEPVEQPKKTDYDSTSDEKNLFNYLKDLGEYFKDSDTKEDDIWNAYKGEKQYASPDAEAKARHAALATLGANNLTDVSDDYLKALKEDNAWAFDRDDQAIHDFLVANQGLSAEELKIRNVYFANLEDSVIETMRNNLSSDNLVNGSVYDGYLAIKKQFWPNSVTLSLAPTIADFTASSDEQRVFDYIDGANGLQAYFNQFAQLTSEEKINKVLNAFNANDIYTADGDNVTALLNANSITDVSDDFWVQIKENNGWVRDADDTSIRDQLINEFINTDENKNKSVEELVAEVQEQNAQFKNLGNKTFADGTKGTNVIAKMISNAKDNKSTLEDKDVYRGYLSIKKEFWASGDNIDLTFVKPGSNDFNSVKGRIENYINSCINDNTKVKSGNKEDGLNESLAAFTVIRYKDPNTQETEYYLTLEDGRTYDFRYNDVKTQVGYAGNNAYVIPISNTNYYGIANVSSNNFPGLNMGDVIILESGAAYIYRDPYISNKVYPYTSDESYYDSQTALVKLNIPIQ